LIAGIYKDYYKSRALRCTQFASFKPLGRFHFRLLLRCLLTNAIDKKHGQPVVIHFTSDWEKPLGRANPRFQAETLPDWNSAHPPFKRIWSPVIENLDNFLQRTCLPTCALTFRKPEVHYKAVNLIRNLLTSHDFDPRYNATPHRSRVANLYLPLVAVIIDNLSKLHSWTVEGESRIVGGNNPNEHLNLILNVISDNLPNVRTYLLTEDLTYWYFWIWHLYALTFVITYDLIHASWISGQRTDCF
jgi:hypothetical protein